MSCYLSTSCYGNSYLKDSIEMCRQLNPLHIEISAPHKYQPIDELELLLKSYTKEGVKFSLHNYFPPPEKSFVLNIASNDDNVISNSKELIEGALRLCISSNSKLYGIHPGYLYSGAKANKNGNFIWNEESKSSYENCLFQSTKIVNQYFSLFKENGVHFLLENLFPSPARKTSLFCTLQDIDEFLSMTPKDIGLLLDLGHMNITCNLMGTDKYKFLDEFLDRYGSRLVEVHISENNGRRDQHLPVKKNSWQLNAINLIKSIKLDLDIDRVYCLESRNANKDELSSSLNLINEVIL